jgi:hypothetical protein
MLQVSAQDEHDIEPLACHRHGCKDRAHLEKNACLGRRSHNVAACLDQVSQALVQLDHLYWLAIEKLLHGELTAGVCLIAMGELAAAAGTGPEGLPRSRLRVPFSHGVSNSAAVLRRKLSLARWKHTRNAP